MFRLSQIRVSPTSYPGHQTAFPPWLHCSVNSKRKRTKSALGTRLGYRKGIRHFNWDEFKEPVFIGEGGFGKVYSGKYKGSAVVVKIMKDADDENILKEAKFHSRLEHENLVKLISICPSRKALMLEYVFFDFNMFGFNQNVSSLANLLEELDKVHFKGFEHIIPLIASDIICGLRYLHDQGVAHRDLKPGNILISNQHLLQLKQAEKHLKWLSTPCVAKLTDFGESWGRLSQSTGASCTHTVNVYKGTPAFMPPELVDPKKRLLVMREDDLKYADI